jgi:UDP-N-acetylmuramate dehydrogenase
VVHAQHDVPLAPLTTLRIGGPARRLVHASSEEELVALIREADADAEPLLLLAGGSNVVVADEGFEGTVVLVATRGVRIDEKDDGGALVRVAAGENWDALVERLVGEGLAGVECLAGIPGSVGATPIQNVGAYGQEVAATLVSVRVLDRHTGEVVELPAADCGLSYRSSRFKRSGRHAVLEVALSLERSPDSAPVAYAELARMLGVRGGDRVPLADARAAVLELRRGKGMVLDAADHDTWSAGSFFTNPLLTREDFGELEQRVHERLGDELVTPRFPEPDGRIKTSAAWLIERCGFARGDSRGPVAISGKHALALTNRGGGTARELVGFAREIAAGVRGELGVHLEPEPVLVGIPWQA